MKIPTLTINGTLIDGIIKKSYYFGIKATEMQSDDGDWVPGRIIIFRVNLMSKSHLFLVDLQKSSKVFNFILEGNPDRAYGTSKYIREINKEFSDPYSEWNFTCEVNKVIVRKKLFWHYYQLKNIIEKIKMWIKE